MVNWFCVSLDAFPRWGVELISAYLFMGSLVETGIILELLVRFFWRYSAR